MHWVLKTLQELLLQEMWMQLLCQMSVLLVLLELLGWWLREWLVLDEQQ